MQENDTAVVDPPIGLIDAEGRVICPESITIECIGGLRALLDEAFQNEGEVTIDASGVRSVDTAGLQLLAAFMKSRSGLKLGARIVDASMELRLAAERLGLVGPLGIPAADVADAGVNQEDQ